MRRPAVQNHSRQRRGFVLVLTLAMILIAVTLTGRTAHRSLSRTLQSIEAEQELRHRWERLSLQRALLSRAGFVFEKAEEARREMPHLAWYDGRVTLTGTTYALRLSDENAKVNLNHARRTCSREQFSAILAEAGMSNIVDTLENTVPNGVSEPPVEIESWGSLGGSRSPGELPRVTSAITLWGDGRINLRRSSDWSVRMMLEPLLGSTEVDALLRQRRDHGELFEERHDHPIALAVPASAASSITLQSRCHALWITSTETGDTEFHVREWFDRRSVVTSFRW